MQSIGSTVMILIVDIPCKWKLFSPVEGDIGFISLQCPNCQDRIESQVGFCADGSCGCGMPLWVQDYQLCKGCGHMVGFLQRPMWQHMGVGYINPKSVQKLDLFNSDNEWSMELVMPEGAEPPIRNS